MGCNASLGEESIHDQQKTLALVEEMLYWIIGVSSIGRQPEEAYQIVCDYYDDWKAKLRASKEIAKDDAEKICCDNIINALDRGYNFCHNWVYSGQCIAHFTELRGVIRENANVLKSLKKS